MKNLILYFMHFLLSIIISVNINHLRILYYDLKDINNDSDSLIVALIISFSQLDQFNVFMIFITSILVSEVLTLKVL